MDRGQYRRPRLGSDSYRWPGRLSGYCVLDNDEASLSGSRSGTLEPLLHGHKNERLLYAKFLSHGICVSNIKKCIC